MKQTTSGERLAFNPRYKYIDPAIAKNIGEFCRILREREQMSTREFGKVVGEDHANIVKIENGETIRPMAYLQKIQQFVKSKREEEIMVQLLIRTLVIPKKTPTGEDE